jgi:branched-chain amino acid transport system ATP-binding protein
MLEVRGLEVGYGPVVAVDGVDLEVGEHEIVGLLGPNGAGKTSLLRAISGLVRYRGSVLFDGVDCRAVGVEAAARAGLIHVPEGRHVFPTMSAHDNLQMGLTARGHRPSAFSLDDVYDLFPALGGLRARAGWTLSGGEQQMVAIGRALVAAPRLLLLDEPSLGLAPKVSSAVFAALRAVAGRTAMVVVEQNTSLALGLCARASVLADGRTVMEGLASELRDRETLLASYLGQRTATAR